MYFVVVFILFMIVIIGILAVIEKITGIQIFEDPMDDDWFHW